MYSIIFTGVILLCDKLSLVKEGASRNGDITKHLFSTSRCLLATELKPGRGRLRHLYVAT